MIWETPPPILQNWKVSPECANAVICVDTAILRSGMASQHNFESDYGGYLVAESIGNDTVRTTILQAPAMLKLLLKALNEGSFLSRNVASEAYRIVTTIIATDNDYTITSMEERAYKNARNMFLAEVMHNNDCTYERANEIVNSNKTLQDRVTEQANKLRKMYEQLSFIP